MGSAQMKRRLEAENQLTIEDGGKRKESVIKLYRDFKTVGKEMKEDFFFSKEAMKKREDRFEFRISKHNEAEGVLGMAYGTFLVSSLLERYETKDAFSDNEKRKLKQTVLDLLRYTEENGYDISPYGDSELNHKIFVVKKYSFIESLTWAMSCFLYARRMHVNGLIDFSENMNDLATSIAKCLYILLTNVIHSDESVGYKEDVHDYIGWGPITGCTETSLYFTHSVCETFGDIEDTILGNAEIGIKKDKEFYAEVNEAYKKLYRDTKGSAAKVTDALKCFENVCCDIGMNLYEKYKGSLGKSFFYADGSEVTSNEQIAYSMQSPVLLNQLYVVLSIVYVNYYKVLKKQQEKNHSKKMYDEFCDKLKKSVNMVYDTYETLKSKGKENIVNREYTTFIETHSDREINAMLSNVRISVAILETLIIKAKTMVVTYVTKYPEKEIGNLLNILDENASGEERWIWSKNGYDLQFTERSVSAIREFYDYYEEYQKVYAEVSVDEDIRVSQLLEEKERLVADNRALGIEHENVVKELKEAHRQELERQAEKIRSEFKLEMLVREIVNEQVQTALTETLTSSLDSIVKFNQKSSKKLSENNEKIKSAFERLIESYLYNLVITHQVRNAAWEDDQIVELAEEEFKTFMIAWISEMIKWNNPREHEKNVLESLIRKNEQINDNIEV